MEREGQLIDFKDQKMAEEWVGRGDRAFATAHFEQAVQCYTEVSGVEVCGEKRCIWLALA